MNIYFFRFFALSSLTFILSNAACDGEVDRNALSSSFFEKEEEIKDIKEDNPSDKEIQALQAQLKTLKEELKKALEELALAKSTQVEEEDNELKRAKRLKEKQEGLFNKARIEISEAIRQNLTQWSELHKNINSRNEGYNTYDERALAVGITLSAMEERIKNAAILVIESLNQAKIIEQKIERLNIDQAITEEIKSLREKIENDELLYVKYAAEWYLDAKNTGEQFLLNQGSSP